MAFSWKAFFSLRRTNPETVANPRRGFSISGGVLITDDTAMKISAFHRGVIYVSTQIAKLPWDVKDKDNKTAAHDDRVAKLIRLAPNPEMNSMSFRLWAIQTAIIAGNAYAEIERDSLGRPTAIWPLDSKNVELWRDNTGKLFYKVYNFGGGNVFIRPENIFHLRNFHTKDGLQGQGIVAYAVETLGISAGADKMARNLFANGGIPAGILKHPGTLSDAAYERIKTSWKEQNTGDKSSGVALLEEGTDFEAINIDPDVLQFLESRKFGVLEIARFLGVPPTKLFDMSNATFSNVENANLEVATDTLDAWANNLEMEADVKLLSNRFGGRFSQIDLYAVFRGDMAARATYFKNMMSTGALTPNEIREYESLPGYEGGDRYYIATNNYSPADRIDELFDAQVRNGGKANNSNSKDPKEDDLDDELKKAAIKKLSTR